MPRKKRQYLADGNLSSKEEEQMSPRKTRQRTLNKIKKDSDTNADNLSISKVEPSNKKRKLITKKIKAKNENGDSDLSTNENMSIFSIKDENFPQNISEFENSNTSETDLLEVKKSKSQKQIKRKNCPKANNLSISNKKSKINGQNKKKDIKPKDNDNTKFKPKNALAEKKQDFTDSGIASSSFTKDETALQVLTRLEFDTSKIDKITKNSTMSNDYKSGNESSSDSDWEEVVDNKEQNLDDYNPEIPKDGVEITIDCPEVKLKRKKKQFDHMEYIRLYINRERKEHQLNVHKTHLLCLFAHGFYVNNLLNSSLLQAFALSVLPPNILTSNADKKVDKIGIKGIQTLMSWFCNFFTIEDNKQPFIEINQRLSDCFQHGKCLNASEFNLIFIILARTLGLKTRFCVSLYSLSYKAKNLLPKPGSKNRLNAKKIKTEPSNSLKSVSIEKTKQKSVSVSKKSIKKSASISNESTKNSDHAATKHKSKKLDNPKEKTLHPRRSTAKNYKISSDESNSDNEDEDFIIDNMNKKEKLSKKTPVKPSNRKILSSDSAPSSPETSNLLFDKIVCWAEIFCKIKKQWFPIECSQRKINEPYEIEKLLPQPVTYIIAFDNESYVKDVTRRYVSEYMTSTVKLRADPDWWEKSLEPFAPPNSKLDDEEEKNLEETLINKPLPQSISGFKNHPLYALKRHLLKFEAIYPPDAAPVGFLRGEPVYARECVCQLHSRETWLKEARVVRIGEDPYKIVKARPKWDRMAGVMKTDLPLEIFGFWQTEPYKPPVAVDGKIPRNEYGNVELFKPCMLPIGTVHLQISGLNRIAKKLGIDCSPAVVGFDGHKGSIHPVFDGFVVCKEYKDTLLAAWDEEQENARKREEEKREKRIYGNWKKLIRGLLIRERIKLKYDVK